MTTYETAENRYTTVNGIRFAYRRLGAGRGIPLVMLMHFRSAAHPSLPSPVIRVVELTDPTRISSLGEPWTTGIPL